MSQVDVAEYKRRIELFSKVNKVASVFHNANPKLKHMSPIDITDSKVFKKPKIKKYFSKEQVEEFFELLDESSDCIELVTKSNICRDEKDNYLVSLAIDSHANFLITGDKDLLELDRIGETLVVKFSDFEQLLKQ